MLIIVCQIRRKRRRRRRRRRRRMLTAAIEYNSEEPVLGGSGRKGEKRW